MAYVTNRLQKDERWQRHLLGDCDFERPARVSFEWPCTFKHISWNWWEEHFPRLRLQRKPLLSDSDMHHGMCVTRVPWCMSESPTRGGGKNVPGIPGACTTRNFMYLARVGIDVLSPSHQRASCWLHYNDAMMSAMTSQISSLKIVYPTVYSGADQRKTSKLCVTGLCAGNSPVTGEFPSKRASNEENVSIWWRHYVGYD